MRRNGFIDIAKFMFALIIAEFHVNSGIFPDGRMGCEVFFMISGYLMVCSLAKDQSRDHLAVSTGKFIWRKYKALFWFLLPAAIISYIVICVYKEWTLEHSLVRLPLLSFEVVPFYSTGMLGEYVVGVSWYLSSMFFALAILYPLCKKFRQTFSLMICPLVGVLGYGALSHFFGNLAVNKQYIPETIIRSGLLRSIAACALGCFLHEISKRICTREPTKTGRTVFTVVELVGYAYLAYIMHHYPKTLHEYVLVFVIFALLFIGINGLSFATYLWNPKWTKYFGTASTLIVLCHSCWVRYLEKELGKGFQKTADILWYVLAIALTCIAVYVCSLLLKRIFALLGKIRLWEKPQQGETSTEV